MIVYNRIDERDLGRSGYLLDIQIVQYAAAWTIRGTFAATGSAAYNSEQATPHLRKVMLLTALSEISRDQGSGK